MVWTGSIIKVSASDKEIDVTDSTVSFENGYVVETERLLCDNTVIDIVRTTYENNISNITVIENGVESSWNYETNYQHLLQVLQNSYTVSLFRVPSDGLTYQYVNTYETTSHLTPSNKTYADILSWVSLALSPVNATASTIAAIASIIFNSGAADFETWITTKRVYYEVFDSAGNPLGYYYCDYTITTEAMINGSRQRIDYKTGNFTTLWI